LLIGKQITPTVTETDFPYRLRTAIGRVSRRLRSTAAGSELTPTATSVLFSIARLGPIGASELAEAEDLNPTMVSRVCASLAAKGLVMRTPHPEDRRAAVLEATRAGKAMRKKIQRERADALGAELDRLSPEHFAALEAAIPALEELGDLLRDRSA
jgi:DNA-binding MarR family transcriptional regulator